MTTIFIIILILSQLICFYFIIILNLKISKFKDLETRQDKLIREMDDAIAAYLIELREENDRFIKELQNVKENNGQNSIQQPLPAIEPEDLAQDIKIEQKKIIPKNVVVSAYAKQKTTNSEQKETETTVEQKVEEQKKEPETFEEKVIQLHNEGKTIEEIAKITEKGKTEIELLLKFHT